MAGDIEAVIAALRIALEEAQKSDAAYWKADAANRWIGQLPGPWKRRWKSLKLRGDGSGDVHRHVFIGHVRATLAFLEASSAQMPASANWWPMRRRSDAAQTAAKAEPKGSPTTRPVNLLRIRKPMPGLH